MNADIFNYIDPSPSSNIQDGKLTGKLVTVQPNMCVRGWPVNAGSVALEKYTPLENATVIERLQTSGAIVKGSTQMSELGFGLNGDTSARALAENLADIAMMIDTMGEARVAAAKTSVFGFKPSYGIISRAGLIGLVPSMESFAILSKKLEDIPLVMEAIAGMDDKDLSMPECELPDFSQFNSVQKPIGSIGVVKECIEILDPDESKAFNAVLSNLQKSGLKIQELCIKDFELSRIVHNIIGSVEASSSAGKYDSVRYGHRTSSSKNWNEMYLKSRAESFGLLVKTYLFQGAYFQFENYSAFENACRIRAKIVRQTDELLKKVNVLAFTTVRPDFNAGSANTINDVYDTFTLTLLANLTGLPSITLPGFLYNKQTDMGLQLIGTRLNDEKLLSIGSQLLHLSQGEK